VVVVDVLQADSSRILGVMSDPQSGRGGPDHAHGHGHSHGSRSWVFDRLRHLLRPHSHDATGKVDAAMEVSAEGIRALWISLAVLGGTALLQAVVVAVSGSVALLGDTLHNAADALTAVPLGIAFVVGRRLMDAVDPALVDQVEQTLRVTPGVLDVGQVRLRWIGHHLRAECEVIVDAAASAVQAHQVAVDAEHNLLHALPRLAAALVHADPQAHAGDDHHAVLAPHR
jgi:divalent metal cation (Fe/Co/Zn/Cd) transporter